MKRLLIASAIAALGTSAMAADVVYEAPPVEAPMVEAPVLFSWTGANAGVQGGFGWADYTESANGNTVFERSLDGASLGGFIGYDHQFANNFVLGAVGDLEYNWNEKDGTLGTANYAIDTDMTYSVRARAGYAMDRTLIYATAGWAGARVDKEIVTPSANIDSKSNMNGYTVGAGVDFAITDNMFTRAEYRYTDFGSDTVNGVKMDLDQHAVKVGLGVKF